MRSKTKVIGVRLSIGKYRLLQDILNEINRGRMEHKITMSELIKNIIDYFFMAYTLGEFRKTLPELRKEFIEFLSDIKNKDDINYGQEDVKNRD